MVLDHHRSRTTVEINILNRNEMEEKPECQPDHSEHATEQKITDEPLNLGNLKSIDTAAWKCTVDVFTPC